MSRAVPGPGYTGTVSAYGDTEAPQWSGSVSFDTSPDRYRHWRLTIDGAIATLALQVDEDGGLVPGYELKMNSYDLGVDIELHDAVQRLRFEHPEVRCVVVTSGRDRTFSSGANIRMLAQSSHPWKVNFCKFTNETRNAIEDAIGVLRPDLPRRAERDGGRRRVRDSAGVRADPSRGRQLHRGVTAGNLAAGRAARHGRPHPGDRQTQGTQGSRRRVRHPARGRTGQDRRRLGTGRRGRAPGEFRRRRTGTGAHGGGPVHPTGATQPGSR